MSEHERHNDVTTISTAENAAEHTPAATTATSDAPSPAINVNHYAYRVRWNAKDTRFVASCAELPGITFSSESQLDAFVGIRNAADDEVQRLIAKGEEPPIPLAERHYSGRILVRIPPELHRKLTIDAAEQNISLNRLISNRLAEA